MITCQDAQHLFGRYLDGELQPSLQTELNAHRLNCTSCQNDLAIMEACGDVIGLDHPEPALNSSFTDRVLLARRSRVLPKPRRWSRAMLLVGSPMAAAASLGFAFFVIAPSANPIQRTAIAGTKLSAPGAVQEYLQENNPNRHQSPEARNELATTPEMPVDGFLEAWLAPLVEKSRTTLEGTRRSAEELTAFLHQGFADTNDMLVAEWRSANRSNSSNTARDGGHDLDGAKTTYPNSGSLQQESDQGSSNDRVLEPL